MDNTFNWPKAFEDAFGSNRKLLDEHIEMARKQILLPLLRPKLQSIEDAEEVCSIVITKFWERFFIREEPLPKNVNGYLYRMANNAYFHFSKQKRKDEQQYLVLNDIRLNFVSEKAENNAYETQVSHEEKEYLLTILEQAFQTLGEKCKQLLTKSIFENRKIKNIHQELGIPTANAATKKKQSCINHLRKLMYKKIRENKK